MLLEKIDHPKDLKLFPISELDLVAREIRDYIVSVISKNGGHLGSALAVVELAVALHFVFDSPHDKIIWDIGHQAYAHKILTGRREAFKSIRTNGGISGFCNIRESEHDIFGAGHSSTSIAVLAGLLKSNPPESEKLIAVIGDGSIASGMAFEGLNSIGHEKDKGGIIIINDNDMSISPTVGNLRNHLTSLRQTRKSLSINDLSRAVNEPELYQGANIFTHLGYGYIGVAPGHNIELLVALFKLLRDKKLSRTIVVHIETKKDSHAVSPLYNSSKPRGSSYTQVLSKSLIEAIKEDDSINCISAAMTHGTGLDPVARLFPDNVFDVGISEQAAVTMAGAMSMAGKKPILAIYSTFLQRAYDQIIHDIALQKLPARIMIDRSGYVGEDGPTHNGAFDIAFLRIIPNLVLMSPRNGLEMMRMIKTSLQIEDRPSAIRYSKYGDPGELNSSWEDIRPIKIGKGSFLKEGGKICLIGVGHIVNHLAEAANHLEKNHGIVATVFDARFIKPLDHEALEKISRQSDIILSCEDGCAGGVGSAILELLTKIGYKGSFEAITHPDEFLPQGKVENLHKIARLDADSIASAILSALQL